jgi:hypothetical protein
MICKTINEYVLGRLRNATFVMAISTFLAIVPPESKPLSPRPTIKVTSTTFLVWTRAMSTKLFYNGSGWSDEDLTADTSAVPGTAGSSIFT